ncbi:MAG TPA: hypothetical protein VF092_05000 [Longimicrobium sp.]
MLNPEDLKVESFLAAAIPSTGGTLNCCTGCTSGCGINPTAGGCESASGDPFLCKDGTIIAVD